MSVDGAHLSSWGTWGWPWGPLAQPSITWSIIWSHHPSRCPHDYLLTHQHLLFPLSGGPPTRNHVARFLTLFKALFQYHPSGKQCWTTQCKTVPAPPFSVPSSCFILVNTYHLIHFYLLVSRLAVHRQWPSPGWNLHKAAVLHFVSHLSKPPRRMLGRNDKISGVCFKGFYRTKIRCCVWESRQTHVINGPRQNACLSFCYYHR